MEWQLHLTDFAYFADSAISVSYNLPEFPIFLVDKRGRPSHSPSSEFADPFPFVSVAFEASFGHELARQRLVKVDWLAPDLEVVCRLWTDFH